MTQGPARILIAAPQHEKLAKRIVDGSDGQIQLWPSPFKKFPDSWPNLWIERLDEISQAHVSFLMCINKPEDFFEQYSVLLKLAKLCPRSLKVFLPYFATGTMERADHQEQVVTAATLASLFGNLPQSGPGPIKFYIHDLHVLSVENFFPVNITVVGRTGTKYLKKRLEGHPVSIAFPDSGAAKRFERFFPDYPIIVCDKVRRGTERIITLKEGDPKDCDVVIVDDLIHSGETLLKCLKLLKSLGARTVSLYATHGVLEQDAWKKFLDPNLGVHSVYITDSCPENLPLDGQGPFTILSLADSIRNVISQPW